MKYSSIKELYGFTDSDVAKWFGYSNVISFLNSPRKPNIEVGIENFHKVLLIRKPKELSAKQRSELTEENFDTPFKKSEDIHYDVRDIKNKPSKKTIDALLNFEAVIVIGKQYDLHKVIFVMNDYRFFNLSIKLNNFSQSIIGKPNKKAVIEYLKSPNARIYSRAYFFEEVKMEIENLDFNTKFIAINSIIHELVNHNNSSEALNPDLKSFCISILQ